jgi:multisubunit Na+/H+ antiporter MnhE subunit
VTRAVRVAAALAAIYALTLSSADPADLLFGFLVGAVLVALTQDRLRAEPRDALPPLGRRAAWMPVFVGAVLADVVRGTWDVALRVLHLRSVSYPGIVRIPIGARSERGVAVSALLLTLSPGSVLLEIDWDRRDLVFHVIDARDPDGVRAAALRFYERYQRRIFP